MDKQPHQLRNGALILITGANTGIGFEVAKQAALLECKPRIILACRDLAKASAAALEVKRIAESVGKQAADITPLKVDLASKKSIRDFHAEFVSLFHDTPLDALVLNAGMAHFEQKRPTLTVDGDEAHFSTNYLGHFYLTHLLLPNLKKSPCSRVVAVSSSLHDPDKRYRQGEGQGKDAPARSNKEKKPLDPSKHPFIDFSDVQMLESPARFSGKLAYMNSKLALVLFVNELTRRLHQQGIKNVECVSLCPGFIPLTDLFRNSNACTRCVVQLCIGTILRPFVKFTRTVEQGASLVIACATQPLPPALPSTTAAETAADGDKARPVGCGGGYYRLNTESSSNGRECIEAAYSSFESYNEDTQTRLYDWSCAHLGVNPIEGKS